MASSSTIDQRNVIAERVVYDPFTAEFQNDPFSVYRRLRAEAPVYHNPKWDFYALSRFDDVRAALRDHETYLNYEGVDIDDFEQEQRGPGLLPDLDNPRHDQLRKVVQRAFMPRSIKALAEETRATCDRLIDAFGDRRDVDLAEEFAWPIPFEVFFDFLGMPRGDIREKFIHWTHGIKDREVGSPDLTPFARESTRELRDYLAELLRERRENPRRDVLTTIVQAEIDGVPLTPEDIDPAAEAVGLCFALYIAGIETTAGQMSTLFEQLALNPDQQLALREDPELIPLSVEESLRFRSIFQVTGRTTAKDVDVRGVRIPSGKRVFLILGSANQDERVFDDPERFDIFRPPAPHLAFGEGLHGCLGNPLARLEATVALEQLVARRGMFSLAGRPRRYTTTPNAYVLDRVPVTFAPGAETAAEDRTDLQAQRLEDAGLDEAAAVAVSTVPTGSTAERADVATELEVCVVARSRAASDVALLTLAAPDGADLPPWTPGAHLDLLLGNGLVRQYSLCGDPSDRSSYTVGVLLSPTSRGGSSHVHEELLPGRAVTIHPPRNHFELVESPKYLFIAGGIGITPIAAMVREAQRLGRDWKLVYTGRTEESMAFREEFEQYPDRVTIVPSSTRGRVDLDDLLGTPDPRTAIYVCGPEPLLTGVEQVCHRYWPAEALHLERFAGKVVDTGGDSAFEVELAKSGRLIVVPADVSVLQALEENGVHVLSSCGEGTCGTCETRVLDGEVDHRDTVLTRQEQAGNDCMMVCVSRASCPRLVLDV